MKPLSSISKRSLIISLAAIFTLFIIAVVFYQSRHNRPTTEAHITAFNLTIQHWETIEGTPVYFAEVDELPILDIQVLFDAGSARDGQQYGIAQLTNALLDQGTKHHNADEIALGFDEIGAIFSQQVDRDYVATGLRTLTDRKILTPAIVLFIEALSTPSFPKDAFSREQARQIAALENSEQDPGDIAERAIYQSIYGSHPYANPPLGNKNTVKNLSPEQLRSFHQQYYTAENAVIAIVGDISHRQAQRISAEISSSLPQGTAAAKLPDINIVEPAPTQTVQNIDYPSAQTHIILGQPSVTRSDPDYFAFYVGNHILGASGLVSLLFHEIRSKHALAYNVYSRIIPMKQPGPFFVGMQTRDDQAPKALALLKTTIEQFTNEGPIEEAVTLAKANLVGGFPLRLGSNAAIVTQIAAIGFYDLPLDYLETFVPNVEAVTAKDIQAAFQRVVQPNRLKLVQVGPHPSADEMSSSETSDEETSSEE